MVDDRTEGRMDEVARGGGGRVRPPRPAQQMTIPDVDERSKQHVSSVVVQEEGRDDVS
jgi:hypothetical protein